MFDNLPFIVTDIGTILAFLNSGHLDFKGDSNTYHPHTGEQLKTDWYKYKNLTIKVFYNVQGDPIRLTSTGSFHYLMNNGLHNANNFTFQEMREFLLNFQNLFNIDLRKLKLSACEFGINIIIPFDVEKVVQYTYTERRKSFIPNSPGNPSKISGTPKNDYRLKVYSKWHEYPQHCEKNTLRLEYKGIRTRGIKSKCHIETVYDLLSLKIWIKIKDFHLNYFKHLVLFDYKMIIPQNSKFKKRANGMKNPHYWEDKIKETRKGEQYSAKYNEDVKTLNSFSKKYGSDMLSIILKQAELQWNKNLQTCMNCTGMKIEKPKHAQSKKPMYAPFKVCEPCLHFKLKLGGTPPFLN